jgi:uncharacterized protein
MYMNNGGIYLISILFMGLGMLAQYMLKKRFNQYSVNRLSSGLSGKEVAEKMLKDAGIYDVQVVSVGGMLTDHYNPANKTVNLSDGVYNSCTIAAAAVAAHECGHAVQHATQYSFLTMRSKLVPVVNISSSLLQWVLLAGVLLINVFPTLLLVGVALFAVTTLFSVITLPVEFDASNRALAWLEKTNVTNNEEQPKAKNALKWAASTYVVAALASIANLLYYLQMYLSSRNRNN